MEENEILKLCSKNIGVAFYFYQKPSVIKENIKYVISEYHKIANIKMNFFMFNDGKMKNMRGKIFPQYAYTLIDNYDFNNSFCVHFYNDSKEKCHDSAVEMYLSDFDSEKYFSSKMPNILYFEFSITTDLSDIYFFIKKAFDSINFFYVFCNPVISGNPLYYPKSFNLAVRQLKNNIIFAPKQGHFTHSFEFYLQHHMVGTTNLIQFFSNEFKEYIFENSDLLNNIPENIFLKEYINCFSFSLLNFKNNDKKIYFYDIQSGLLEKYKILNAILKNIITYDYGKDMFFKKDDWQNWITRFK